MVRRLPSRASYFLPRHLYPQSLLSSFLHSLDNLPIYPRVHLFVNKL